MEEIYIFQNWDLGRAEKDDNYDKWCDKINYNSDKNGIYKHTDSQWGFLYMSFNKESLVKFAKGYTENKFKEVECEFEFMKKVKEKYDKL